MSFDTPLRKPLQPGQISPVISSTLRYKKSLSASRFQCVWGLLDVFIFFLLLFEVKTQYLQLQFVGESDVFRYFLIGICASFAVSAVVNFLQAIQSVSVRQPILSPKQKQLLGIMQDGTSDFKTQPDVQSVGSIRQPLNISALTSSTPTQQQRPSPISHSPHLSPLTLGRPLSNSPTSSPNISQNAAQKFYKSQNASYIAAQRRFSPNTQGSPITNLGMNLDGSSYHDSSGGGSPFLRHRRSPYRNSPLSPDDFMVDQKTLNMHLRSHHLEKEQQRLQMLSLENSFNSSAGKWGFSKSSFMETSQELLKNVYQMATPSPKSTTSRKDDKDAATKYAALEYWKKYGITADDLSEWTARTRRWISATLLLQLVAEIQKINSSLKKLGCPEIQVGESSISSLKQIIASRGAQIPNLIRLLPYLEVTSNQEYLISRLKRLASGGYMSEFKWNSGGEVKGRKWADDMPTDCEIIMHVFCVYMDSHLPADPRFPDGKTFSSKYFVRAPDKPKPVTDDAFIIHQSKINPPDFRIIGHDSDYNVPPGRNNIFHALLLFLHDVKEKKDGMLGQVNLGASGINILWILEDEFEIKRY
ncbi:transmembrane protein 209-like [Styela clava]|uniref:transmembrane protein 209-like n=1 Tax=Styela clava TaxID=7725 RepID=UPI00193975A1|nr:transmembrane protein 209-like [Styela clava]